MTQMTQMTPEEEQTYYADPANRVLEGEPVRRKRSTMSDPVTVRLPRALLSRVKSQAEVDDRSLSSWIRRAVEHELAREAS